MARSQPLISIIIGIFCIIAPILLLPLSVYLFRKSNKTAIFCFLLFSFYFGWFYPVEMDLLVHYKNFARVANFSLIQLYNDLPTLYHGKEPYPIFFKFLLGKISTKPEVFSAVACTAYASAFMFFMHTFSKEYRRVMTPLHYLLLASLFIIVEYYWFLGFRYWTGFFVFLGFYCRYLRDGKKVYLFLSLSCLCFHFAHLAIIAALGVKYLSKKHIRFIYLLALIAVFIRFTDLDIPAMIVNLFKDTGILNEGYTNAKIAESTKQFVINYREQQNPFYFWRNDLLFGTGVITAIFLSKKTHSIALNNNHIWRLSWIMYTFANFSFASMTLHKRLTMIACYLLFTALWSISLKCTSKELRKLSPLWIIFLAGILFFSSLTTIISQRDTLFSLHLWFNNYLF